MSSLLSLSTEIILDICHQLSDEDLFHLLLANRFLFTLLSPTMLRRALGEKPTVVMVHPLTWAIKRGHAGLVKTLVSQPDFMVEDVDDALKQAATVGNCSMITILLEAGYSHDHWPTQQQPLHLSAMNGHAAATKALLDAGANINAKDHRDKTAFSLAIMSPRHIYGQSLRDPTKKLSYQAEVELKLSIDRRVVETLQVLIENGAYAELGMTDSGGGTPLHQGVSYCLGCDRNLRVGTGVLQFLVNNGVSPSKRDRRGARPIDLTVDEETQSPTALKFFLDLGASPNSKDLIGRSLLSNAICCSESGLALIEILLNRGARTSSVHLVELFDSVEYPGPVTFDKILTLLQLHGATFGNDAGRCFTLAAIQGSLDTMKMILQTGEVDINTFVFGDGGDQGTPLQIALKNEREDIVQFLVAQGVEMSQGEQAQVGVLLGFPING